MWYSNERSGASVKTEIIHGLSASRRKKTVCRGGRGREKDARTQQLSWRTNMRFFLADISWNNVFDIDGLHERSLVQS